MTKNPFPLLSLLLLLSLIPGCGTIVTLTATGPPADWPGYIYSGVGGDLFILETDGMSRGDQEISTSEKVVLYTLVAFDLPMSFTLDTMLLPITIPTTIFLEE